MLENYTHYLLYIFVYRNAVGTLRILYAHSQACLPIRLLAYGYLPAWFSLTSQQIKHVCVYIYIYISMCASDFVCAATLSVTSPGYAEQNASTIIKAPVWIWSLSAHEPACRSASTHGTACVSFVFVRVWRSSCFVQYGRGFAAVSPTALLDQSTGMFVHGMCNANASSARGIESPCCLESALYNTGVRSGSTTVRRGPLATTASGRVAPV